MEKKSLPEPPKTFRNLIGPGLVLIAMGLGSGEFVLWPYFVSQFGFGIIWGAILGILFQYFVSNETGRYTLATGNSVFVGFKKLSRFFPAWFIISTFLSFAWPGIIGTGGEILGRLLNIQDFRWLTITMLIIIGLIFTLGGKVYSTLEKTQKIFLLISIPTLILIVVLIVNPSTFIDIAQGTIGLGDGYFLFPVGISIGQFLGAIAYSGAAGNLILSHSFYIQDKGFGMAGYGEGELVMGKESYLKELKNQFELNSENIKKFKRWFNVVALEQFISFVIIGFLSIILLTIIAYELIYPAATADNLNFIFLEAEKLSLITPILGTTLLILGVVFLFTTQLGVFESTSRIMSENIHMSSDFFGRISRSKLFFIFLWVQIVFAIIVTLLNIAAPLQILFLNTLFSALSMFVLSGAVLWLNNSRFTPTQLRPKLFRNTMLLLSFLFFGFFCVIVIIDSF